MKNKVRIGKDFTIRWALLTSEGEPYAINADAAILRIYSPYGAKDAIGFIVSGNIIEWVFKGKDQKHLGDYTIELVENNGRDGMVSVDSEDAFTLVAHTNEESLNDEGAVEIQTIELTSQIALAPVTTGGGGGGSYDDTKIKQDIADLQAKDVEIGQELTELSSEVGGLSEGIALRNVGAEDTDESVEEPDLPTPSVSNEWKCVYDGRLEVGAQNLEFTTYADGTPLKASELILQVYLDAVATTPMQGYIQINSTNNKTRSSFGALYTELDDAAKIPSVSQIKLQASPMYMIADFVDRAVPKIAQGSYVSNHRLGSVTPPQIYEDIVYVRFNNNAKVKDTPPLIKIYAR